MSAETLIRMAANQNILDLTHTIVDWGNLVAHDDYGIFDPSQSDRLIVPPGYRYGLFLANVSWDTNPANDRWAQMLRNGALFDGAATKMAQAAGPERCRLHLSCLVPVAFGEYYQVSVWQNSGSTREIVSGGTQVFGVQFFR